MPSIYITVGILKHTVTSTVCLHRFCAQCIDHCLAGRWGLSNVGVTGTHTHVWVTSTVLCLDVPLSGGFVAKISVLAHLWNSP